MKALISAIIISFLMGCSLLGNSAEQGSQMYIEMFEAMIKEDAGLNRDSEFIALDFSEIAGITDQVKDELIQYFQDHYEQEILFATFTELEQQGLFDEKIGQLQGILLVVEEINTNVMGTVSFTGYKYRSVLGAVGIEGKLHYKKGRWRVKESYMTWIS